MCLRNCPGIDEIETPETLGLCLPLGQKMCRFCSLKDFFFLLQIYKKKSKNKNNYNKKSPPKKLELPQKISSVLLLKISL